MGDKSAIEWKKLDGRQLGAFKTAAKKIGISFERYKEMRDSGLKWCTFCQKWHSEEKFHTDHSRYDNLTQSCGESRNRRERENYDEKGFPKDPGPDRIKRRDGDKIQARRRINHDVEQSLRPHPDDLHCSYCGHKGENKRHEYHHHMGYRSEHHYDVIPLCSSCHREEHDNAD